MRVLAEDRVHGVIDLLLRCRPGRAGEVLVGRSMPQRLASLGVVQIHADDAFAGHIRAVPAPSAPATPAAAPAPPVAVAESHAPPGVAALDDVVGADAVPHQAIRVAG